MNDTASSQRGSWLVERLRKFIQNFSLVIFAVLLALLAGEVAVRIVAPQQLILKRPDVWQPVDTLGWIHRPNVSTTINTGEGEVSLFTDADGFRVGRAGRLDADTKVLLLGDSYAEAFQVEYAQSFAGRLEEKLRKRLGRTVAVRNTAVGGWAPSQYLSQTERSLQDDAGFDLVLVSLFVGNDVIPERMGAVPPRTPKEVHHLRLPRSFSPREVVNAVLYPINDFLEVRSHLFILFKRQADRLLMRLGLTASYFPVVFRKSEANTNRWDVTADICADIAALASEKGIPSVFVLIPSAAQVHTEAFRRHVEGFGIDPDSVDVGQPNRLLSKALEKRDLDVVDLLPHFRRAADSDRRLYGTVDQHFNEAGHDLAAESLEPVLADHLQEQ